MALLESVFTSIMSSPPVRQRGGQKDKKGTSSPPHVREGNSNGILQDTKLPEVVTSELDYKIALAAITILAFITRFWGIGHPNEVVFDEVHFGKVSKASATTTRRPRLPLLASARTFSRPEG